MLLQGWDDNYRPTRKQKGGKNSSYYTMVRIQGFVSIWVWGESEKEWCECVCVHVHVFSAVRIGKLWCFDVLKIWFYSTINVVFAIGEWARREKIYKEKNWNNGLWMRPLPLLLEGKSHSLYRHHTWVWTLEWEMMECILLWVLSWSQTSVKTGWRLFSF